MADQLENSLFIAAEAVRKAEEQALAGRLALEMIHEIKNPLEALGHLTYLALLDADNPEAVRQYMETAEEQMDLLRHIIGETLGFARPSQPPRIVGAIALAEAALRIHQRQIDTKKIHLVKRFPKDVETKVHTGQMLQVLSNLIVNALDALPPNGTLHLRIREWRGKLHIVVADNGQGIPEEHRERIFEPFFSTKGEQGNGLGLALSKQIVERHQGKIRLRSSVRQGRSGTTFKIILPTAQMG